MSIDSRRYVDVLAAGAPTGTQAETDLAAATRAGAIAGDEAGRVAGAAAGREAGTEVAADAGRVAGAAAGEIAGAQAGQGAGATAGAAAGGPAGATAGAAAAAAVVNDRLLKTGGNAGNAAEAATLRTNIGVDTFSTRAAAVAATLRADSAFLQTTGYAAAGDGGGALFRKVGAEPAHPGKLQTANGAWYEIAELVLRPAMFGAAGDGVANDTTALQNTITAALALARPVNLVGALKLNTPVTIAGNVEITGPAILRPSTNAFQVTAGRVKLSDVTLDGASLANSRGVRIEASASGNITLELSDITAHELGQEVLRVEASSANVFLNVHDITARDCRSLVAALGVAGLSGSIRDSSLFGYTRVGISLGTNLEVMQRTWTRGFTVSNVQLEGLNQNDAFSVYGVISYLPYTICNTVTVQGIYQLGIGDNEGIYLKAPFSEVNNCILRDAGTGEGFLNVKGHGRPEAIFATHAAAMAAIGTLNVGALIEILADETNGGVRDFYQVNSTKTNLVIATGAHGYGVSVSNLKTYCTDDYAVTRFPGRDINGAKINTDDVSVSLFQAFGKFRHAIVTAGAQTANRLQIATARAYGVNSPLNAGAFQFSATQAFGTSLTDLLVTGAANADAVQFAGGEDGADYTVTNLTARNVRRYIAARPAANDKMKVTVRDGSAFGVTSSVFYLHVSRLLSLDVQGFANDNWTGTSLFGGNNQTVSAFIFKDNSLAVRVLPNATPTVALQLPVPLGGAANTRIMVEGGSGAEFFTRTIQTFHSNQAGTVALIGTDDVTFDRNTGGAAASWDATVGVAANAESSTNQLTLTLTGQARWKIYPHLEGLAA